MKRFINEATLSHGLGSCQESADLAVPSQRDEAIHRAAGSVG
jgi:hypothetical protein